jgi:Mn-containing catalase
MTQPLWVHEYLGYSGDGLDELLEEVALRIREQFAIPKEINITNDPDARVVRPGIQYLAEREEARKGGDGN